MMMMIMMIHVSNQLGTSCDALLAVLPIPGAHMVLRCQLVTQLPGPVAGRTIAGLLFLERNVQQQRQHVRRRIRLGTDGGARSSNVGKMAQAGRRGPRAHAAQVVAGTLVGRRQLKLGQRIAIASNNKKKEGRKERKKIN